MSVLQRFENERVGKFYDSIVNAVLLIGVGIGTFMAFGGWTCLAAICAIAYLKAKGV